MPSASAAATERATLRAFFELVLLAHSAAKANSSTSAKLSVIDSSIRLTRECAARALGAERDQLGRRRVLADARATHDAIDRHRGVQPSIGILMVRPGVEPHALLVATRKLPGVRAGILAHSARR